MQKKLTKMKVTIHVWVWESSHVLHLLGSFEVQGLVTLAWRYLVDILCEGFLTHLILNCLELVKFDRTLLYFFDHLFAEKSMYSMTEN